MIDFNTPLIDQHRFISLCIHDAEEGKGILLVISTRKLMNIPRAFEETKERERERERERDEC